MNESRVRALFKPLGAAGREKSVEIWLLELCSMKHRRHEALKALQWRAEKRQSFRSNMDSVFELCKGNVPEGVIRSSTRFVVEPSRGPGSVEEEQWQTRLSEWVKQPAYTFQPPTTERAAPSRHPWDGAFDVTFGEFATGIGIFAACFRKAGARCAWMMEPTSSVQCALQMCPETKSVYAMAEEVDPADLEWVHVMVGGPECQPFSLASRNPLGWQDDRSYTFIRAVHMIAVQLPWLAMIENVEAVLTAEGGQVWTLIKGTLEAVGYVVRPIVV